MKKERKKRHSKLADEKQVKPDKSPEKDDRQDQPDFGGLPARDLKKNLGCG